MIISRSPLRITLGGGGTDLPSYYRDHEGFVISAAIDKYVYVISMRTFAEGITLRYSRLEHVERISEVQHPIIREALEILGFKTPQIEITSFADIPAGTGLGSSGSFAILAGGLATRLRPITETIPKALVAVSGQPFINRQLAYLRDQGVSRVVMCVGYLGNMIEEVVGTGEQFGLSVSYAPDGPTLLGTGGALKKALPLLGEHFFVLYGDSFLPINFLQVQQAYVQSKQQALMTVLKNGDRWDKSNVLFTNGRLVEYNKHAPKPDMAYIDYGLSVVSADVLSLYPADKPFDLADVYQELSTKGQLSGLEVHERFYEIGSHEGLKEAEDYFFIKEKA